VFPVIIFSIFRTVYCSPGWLWF